MRSTLEEYFLWMSKSGNKRKVGGELLPAEPLSPRTSLRHLKKTRTVLRDLGYLLYTKNPIPRRPNQWLVNPEKDVRFLSLDEIEGWFASHFPPETECHGKLLAGTTTRAPFGSSLSSCTMERVSGPTRNSVKSGAESSSSMSPTRSSRLSSPRRLTPSSDG